MENDRKKVIEEIGKWKLKQEYVINQKKMGEEYKSISRWLKILTHKDIEKWRKSVGEQVADYITEQSKNRGTIVHEMIKRYLDLSIEDRKNILIHHMGVSAQCLAIIEVDIVYMMLYS